MTPNRRPVDALIGKLLRKEDAARMLRKSFVHQDRFTGELVDENWAALSRNRNRAAVWMLQRRLDFALRHV
jgi:hypothetical protein